MTTGMKLAAGAAALIGLAACVEDTGRSGSGLSGTQAHFDAMTSPCIAQASRLTGVRERSISVIDRIQTGGGPLLTLNVGGNKYSCRLEYNGRVTVFSEYAN